MASTVTRSSDPSDAPTQRGGHDGPLFEDELDFHRYLRIFGRHKGLLLAGALVGALVGLGIGMTRPAQYEGVTTLVAHLPPRPGTGGVDRATLRAFMENQTLATEVLQSLGLNKPPHDFTPQRFSAEALRVEELAGTNLFRVRVQLADPALAAEASRHLAREAVTLNKQVAGDAGAVLRNELKPHLEEAAARLETAEQQLVSYQREAQIELLQADSNALVDERADLFRLKLDIESERARLEAAEAELQGREPVLTAGRLPRAEEALRRAGSIQAKEVRERDPDRPLEPAPITGAGTRRGAVEPGGNRRAPGRVAGSQAQTPADAQEYLSRDLDTVRPSVERGAVNPDALDLSDPLINPVYQTLEFQLATSRARLAALERHRAELMRKAGGSTLPELTSLYTRHVELARRQNEYDLAEEVFRDVSLRHEKATTDLVGSSAYLQVIDEAVQPDRHMPRKRIQTIALGLLCGLFVAAAGAVILESTAASRDAREVRG
jgi:uncharacterized protein involved in exopolysaccharide biosynthesis